MADDGPVGVTLLNPLTRFTWRRTLSSVAHFDPRHRTLDGSRLRPRVLGERGRGRADVPTMVGRSRLSVQIRRSPAT